MQKDTFPVLRLVFGGMALFVFVFAFFWVGTHRAKADPRTDCPAVGKPCKVVVLTDEEQNVLMGDKGILQTAAAARSLDLGGLTTYFQQKIANAPAGDVQKAPVTDPVAPAVTDKAPAK